MTIADGRLKHIAKGQVIRARYLNDQADAISSLQDQIRRPRQNGERAPTPASTEQGTLDSEMPAADDLDSEDQGLNPIGEQWMEIARRTKTVRITNPEDEDQYVDVERIEWITFVLPGGKTVTLTLDNAASV